MNHFKIRFTFLVWRERITKTVDQNTELRKGNGTRFWGVRFG